jgi:predicted PilT family ATPase
VKEAIAALMSSKRASDATPDDHVEIKTSVDVESDENYDIVKITGSKAVVEAARGVILDRAKKIEETEDVTIDIFSSVSSDAVRELEQSETNQSGLEECLPIRSKVIRRIIGKEGKGIKKLRARHGVEFNFHRNDQDDGSSEMVDIKGPKAGVDACRKEMLELVEYEVSIYVNAC